MKDEELKMKAEQPGLVAVIMAGGMGARFWPLSTAQRPKQFLQLFDDRSLLQMSFDRISDLIPNERIMVLTNAGYVDIVKDQLPQIPAENVIGEPMRRDTAAAVWSSKVFITAGTFDRPALCEARQRRSPATIS